METKPPDHAADPIRVAILGAGAWGTTLALVAHRAGCAATLVAHRDDLADTLRSTRIHPVSLPGIRLPDVIAVSADPLQAISNADAAIIAVPTQKLRSGIADLGPVLAGRPVVSAIKGLESDTLSRASEVIHQTVEPYGYTPVVALSGPNLAGEVAAGKPATTVLASADVAAAERLQRALGSASFRIYVSDDIVGVEMGGALKNVIAIGAGIGDGLGAGDNAKSAFLTRGIAEIARLGVACGAQVLTFAGLSGVGDLIATCSSPLSRNNRVGRALAAGRGLPEILHDLGETAEGVETTRAARLLGQRLGVDLPIVEQLHGVLFESVSPLDAIAALMDREPRRERSAWDDVR